MTPAVSVVMPVRDGAALVRDAVASVQAQDGVDWELVVHDDGSSDRTPGVLAALAREDARIRVGRGNGEGAAVARNQALVACRAPAIAFLDHDDLWPSGRLARQLARLAAEPDADGVLGRTLRFTELGRDGAPEPGTEPETAGLLQAGLFRRAAIDATGRFDPALAAADDVDFLLRFAEAGHRMVVEDDVAVWYRQHPAMHTADPSFAAGQTARALALSLRRRRAAGAARDIEWRLAR